MTAYQGNWGTGWRGSIPTELHLVLGGKESPSGFAQHVESGLVPGIERQERTDAAHKGRRYTLTETTIDTVFA
jgi:hypothetical protein